MVRKIWRVLRWFLLALLLVVTVVVIDGWRAFGAAAKGERLARIERSPQWRDGNFENPQPIINNVWGTITASFEISPYASPEQALDVKPIDPKLFETPPQNGLRATWFGHSTVILEIDGHRILTDPMWSERASPFGWIGPRRWYSPPIAIADLPPIDAVVISHDHYDHLDYPTIVSLNERINRFVVPLGIGAHLEYWGVPQEKIVELDWWERTKVRDLEIVCTPARHATGRFLFDFDAKLWASWAFLGSRNKAWFSGDTGLFPGLAEIGRRLGPFDLTLIEAGQYHGTWPDWHVGPEQAVEAHRLVRGGVMFPIHWGMVQLAYHGWTEPIERVLLEGDRTGQQVMAPRPGQMVEIGGPQRIERWWPKLPWDSREKHPIVSSQMSALTSSASVAP